VLADEKAVAAFAEDAVVCVRQVLSTQEAAAAAIDAVLASPGPLAQVASGAGDPGAFSEDFCRWREIPQLGQLARQSRVPAVAAPLAHLTALRRPAGRAARRGCHGPSAVPRGLGALTRRAIPG
jgi:hypothetical protein